MPSAARVTDNHICPVVGPSGPHVGGPVARGEPTVLIGEQAAARVGDPLTCAGPPDAVASGATSVLIGAMAAAHQGSPSIHGGAIVGGDPAVQVGMSPSGSALAAASASGAPFVALD